MSGAKRILPLLAVLCFALFLLYGVYFNAFGANAESMMAFFGITESRQGFVMTIQSLGGIVMTVLLGLFGERLHKLYGLLAGAVIDVCREEPLPPGHPFWDAPRLLLTGHSSAPTEPAALVALFLDNLQRYRDGQPLRGEVDFVRGY